MSTRPGVTPMDVFSGRADQPPRLWLTIIVLVAAFMVAALAWSALAEIDELSRADGRVIPSSKVQIIQNSEAGVVAEILVRAGQQVKKGQQLIRLDDTTTSSSAGEVEARVTALTAQVARLRIEAAGRHSEEFVCPDQVKNTVPAVCDNEADLMRVRAASLRQGKDVLVQRVEQRQRELNEAHSNRERLEQSLSLAREKLDLMRPLAKQKLVAQTEFITAQREVSDLTGEFAGAGEAIGRTEAALAEARLQVDQADLEFREKALSEMNLRLAELASAEEQLRGATDRVTRTEIRSPVDGIVNNLEINTVGGFVSPGSRLMDVVPVADTLLVEARLKPSDIAFILPGQRANIKFTAYDFAIFGGLDGEVQNVSADSIVDPNTRETYYTVLLKTDRASIRYRGEDLPILPGMVSNVEIITGKKTILQYLLKPINKARDEALRER